uniref:HelD family protein n=1 Tax=[Ruminococcus] torques TaxID=33039 RepID=UPI003AEFC5D3
MEQFLKEITDCLQQKIKELDEDLSAGQQEIKNMHEYYWENYTEMDEYGYENYDNQQALLHQVHANEEKLSKRKRLTKMLESPFFGRVDFRYDGEEESETFYIGIGNFAPRAGMRPLIYDWRAPVSGLFYDYDRGPAAYDAPGGRMEGEITSKWQYKIKNGHMIYGFESDTKIDDEILKQELGSGGDVQLKNIVRTIQKEQNAIIRNTEDRILAIQGAAGSGKTSVALHRIAYLLYHDRENLKAANILILSPNNAFSDYISHILPELGEEHIQEMSFDLFAYKELKEVANDCEDRYDYLEKKMKFQDSEWEIRFKEKQSASFIGQMEGFLAMLEEDLVNIRSFTFKGFHKTEEEIIHLFYYKFQTVPLLARMDAVMEYLIDEYETLRGKNISEEDMEALRETFQKMYVTTDLYEIYGWLLKDCGYSELSNAEYERRKLEYEDVFPMLYLKYRLKGSRKHKNIKHLVIDEMQDYSYLQYSILSMLFHCRMTILGDRAQTMDSECQDVTKFLPKIFGRKIRKIVMNKSYRNTLEIAEYAERIRGGEGLELFQRHGKEVEEFHGLSMEEMLENIEKQVKSSNAQYETAAVITMNESDAYDIYRLLKNRQLPVSYMERDTSVFKKGMTVTTFYLAKGLEFDQVFAVLGRETNPLYKQAKYISATRALHELYVYEES